MGRSDGEGERADEGTGLCPSSREEQKLPPGQKSAAAFLISTVGRNKMVLVQSASGEADTEKKWP